MSDEGVNSGAVQITLPAVPSSNQWQKLNRQESGSGAADAGLPKAVHLLPVHKAVQLTAGFLNLWTSLAALSPSSHPHCTVDGDPVRAYISSACPLAAAALAVLPPLLAPMLLCDNCHSSSSGCAVRTAAQGPALSSKLMDMLLSGAQAAVQFCIQLSDILYIDLAMVGCEQQQQQQQPLQCHAAASDLLAVADTPHLVLVAVAALVQQLYQQLEGRPLMSPAAAAAAADDTWLAAALASCQLGAEQSRSRPAAAAVQCTAAAGSGQLTALGAEATGQPAAAGTGGGQLQVHQGQQDGTRKEVELVARGEVSAAAAAAAAAAVTFPAYHRQLLELLGLPGLQLDWQPDLKQVMKAVLVAAKVIKAAALALIQSGSSSSSCFKEGVLKALLLTLLEAQLLLPDLAFTAAVLHCMVVVQDIHWALMCYDNTSNTSPGSKGFADELALDLPEDLAEPLLLLMAPTVLEVVEQQQQQQQQQQQHQNKPAAATAAPASASAAAVDDEMVLSTLSNLVLTTASAGEASDCQSVAVVCHQLPCLISM